MRRKGQSRLGDLELSILNVLWERGPCTVREVLVALSVEPRPAYTTVLTMMRLMHEKGYLERDERDRAHVYSARLREQRVKRNLLRDLINRAFRGSAEALLVRLVEDERLSREELDRVRQMVSQKRRGQQP